MIFYFWILIFSFSIFQFTSQLVIIFWVQVRWLSQATFLILCYFSWDQTHSFQGELAKFQYWLLSYSTSQQSYTPLAPLNRPQSALSFSPSPFSYDRLPYYLHQNRQTNFFISIFILQLQSKFAQFFFGAELPTGIMLGDWFVFAQLQALRCCFLIFIHPQDVFIEIFQDLVHLYAPHSYLCFYLFLYPCFYLYFSIFLKSEQVQHHQRQKTSHAPLILPLPLARPHLRFRRPHWAQTSISPRLSSTSIPSPSPSAPPSSISSASAPPLMTARLRFMAYCGERGSGLQGYLCYPSCSICRSVEVRDFSQTLYYKCALIRLNLQQKLFMAHSCFQPTNIFLPSLQNSSIKFSHDPIISLLIIIVVNHKTQSHETNPKNNNIKTTAGIHANLPRHRSKNLHQTPRELLSQARRRSYKLAQIVPAWSHFQLFSTACYKLGYRPAIFNVYNKIIIECFSVNEKGSKQVTTKDLFVAYLLNELAGNQSESAYRKALEDFRTAI